MDLENVELKPAVEAVLASDDSKINSRPLLLDALKSFVDRRFAGGATAVQRVHDKRQELCLRTELLTDYSDSTVGPYDSGQTIGEAAGFSASPDLGRLLYHLTRAFKPPSAIELGTNIGLSAAYIATGMLLNQGGQLVTLEASRVRLDLARDLIGDFEFDNVVLVPGYFADTLVPTLEDYGPIDFAFIDGHHQEAATLAYFDTLCRHIRSGAVLVFDDIRWSEGMLRAWNSIAADDRVNLAVDLGRIGIALAD